MFAGQLENDTGCKQVMEEITAASQSNLEKCRQLNPAKSKEKQIETLLNNIFFAFKVF